MRVNLNSLRRRVVQRVRQFHLTTVGSIKINVIVCCCIGLAMLVFATHASYFMGWRSDSGGDTTDRNPVNQKGYSIVMNTWKRYDLLKKSISHYTKCNGVKSIHVVWSESEGPSESLINSVEESGKSGDCELRFEINKEDSLNNRFKEIKGLKTEGLFSIDDDILIPCSSMEFAFNVWRSSPDSMVGFVPRMHWLDLHSKGNGGRYSYGGWWSVWWTGKYSMVLSKAAFFHRKYLTLYTHNMPASIRDYVAKNRNCEDIAMSFLVANASGAPPVWVKGKIYEMGSTGISSLGGHSKRRSQCVNRFVQEYGQMPLISSTVKALDATKLWFW